ncbi:hypothetical protein K9B35_08225 [Sphingomonas sp. R647]|uniref:hypothetical protein n=1 Tax=Sphingomonas sp. R647 TaxID=2875233 RepID=UPI001CD2A045|nr:hypothetical protein [Sphingomonas sp. R647]MCA1197949.1 hypothetical protein [Sphingomonas sp. R647]
MPYSSRRSRILGCAALFACAAAALLLFFGWFAGGPYTSSLPRPFNAAAWKTGEGEARCGMIADLQHRIGVVGKTRTELYEMLGRPDDEDGRDPTLDHWHLCPSFMDIYILEVRWKNDRVETAWVRDT